MTRWTASTRRSRRRRLAASAWSPATELSAIDGEREDLHVLGYGIDHRSAALLDALEGFRADRARARTAWPTRCGSSGSSSTLPERGGARSGGPIWRGGVRASRQQDAPAREEDLANFLATPRGLPDPRRARPTAGARRRPSPRRSRRSTPPAASRSGRTRSGTSRTPTRSCRRDRPLRGGRASTASRPSTSRTRREQTRLVAAHCAELGLLTTGSADFHGPDHPRFHAFRAFDAARDRAATSARSAQESPRPVASAAA